jgi:hypothetical protein
MPFTFAHPAAAVPLARPMGRYGVLSALIIGSMAPDIAYLLPIGVMRNESHSLGGLFWYCLPIGLAGYVLYHWFMKRPLIYLLPPAVFARLEPYATSDWRLRRKNLLAVLLSLLVGAITHLVWDSFTHRSSWGVRHIGWLQTHLYTGGGFWIYLYTALQWACSLMGLALLGWWALRWRRATPLPAATGNSPLKRRHRWLLTGFMLIVAVVEGILEIWPYASPEPIATTQELISHAFLGMVSGFGMALIAYCLLFNYWWWRRQ